MSNIGKSSLVRRVAAAAGALALGLAGLAGAALTANADQDAGNIDPSKNASITIHKYSGAQASTHDDGTALSDADAAKLGDPLQNVEFTIKPVLKKGTLALDANAIDNDQAAWDLISGPDGKTPLDPATVTEANGYVFGTPTVKSTEADGTLTTGVLPHGLYLVTETDASKATVNGTPVTVTSTTAPFLVTLPLPQTNGKWLYDVNVYPKNSATAAPTKTINSDADQSAAKQLKVGDTITYTIKQSGL